jgi:two-component system, cell cycle response regulator DivK
MTGTVLIVDDQEDIRCMMAIYLKLNKYEVIEAVNGYEAIEKALAYKPDVILMDMAMPVLNGLDSTRAMKENKELATIPILCVTAYDEYYVERARAAGCDDVLQKPIDFNRLDAFLERHIR